MCVELIRTYGDRAPEFADLWAQYGRLYNASRDQQEAELGTSFGNRNLRDIHSRCTAFAALHANDAELAERAWDELFARRENQSDLPRPVRLEGPDVLNPIEELPLGANDSQWEIAAMECLAFLADFPR